jgi:PAS domain S-box-containing protein
MAPHHDYQSIVTSMNEPVYLCDLEKNLLYLNPAAEKLTGWSLRDALSMKCHEVFGDAALACSEICPFEKASSGKLDYLSHEITYKTCAGDIKRFTASISPVYKDDKISGAVIVLKEIETLEETKQISLKTMVALEKEIHERKKAEEALWKSEERYRGLADATFEAIFISVKGVCIETNRTATEMFGYQYEELIGIFGTDVIAPESKELVKHNMLSGYEEPYEVIAQRKDGTTFHAEIRGKMTEYKGQKVRVTVVHDINDRKEAEVALRQSEETLKAILAASPAGIGLVRRRSLGWANRAMYKMVGYDADSLYGKSFRVLYLDDKEYVRATRELYRGIKETGIGETETRWVRKDGSIIRCYLQSSPLDPSNPANGVITAAINITDQKQAREHIHFLTQQLMKTQESERQILSSELHDSVAQELSAAKIHCDLLLSDPTRLTSSEVKPKIAEISKALHNSINTVRNLAYYLRPSCLDDLGIVEALSQYCEDFSQNNGLTVDFSAVGMENLKLDFDTEINLYRLIQEGLNNINKHADAAHANIRLIAAFPNIILRIEDDGRGFDVKERLALAHQEKRMGLRSMEERVKLLGGKMNIHSQPSKGTRIFIEVPFKTINGTPAD